MAIDLKSKVKDLQEAKGGFVKAIQTNRDSAQAGFLKVDSLPGKQNSIRGYRKVIDPINC